MDATTYYEEIELRFEEKDQASYLVRLTHRAQFFGSIFRIPFKSGEVERALESVSRFSKNWLQRSGQRDALDLIKDIGAQLFASLFEGTAGEIYRAASERAFASGQGLRLRLAMRDEKIASLPWEFLYDTSRQDFVGLSARTSVVRDWGQRNVEFTRPDPTAAPRVLMVTGRMGPMSNLPGIDEEIEVLRLLAARGALDLTVVKDATRATFFEALVASPYEVVIFSGTAVSSNGPTGDEQALCFYEPGDDPSSKSNSGWSTIGKDELVRLLGGQRNLLLVYFSACSTDRLAREISRVVPATIGMRGSPTDRACVAFSKNFFDAIFRGDWLDAGVAQGRRAIDLNEPGNREWGIPVFYLGTAGSMALRTTVEPGGESADFSRLLAPELARVGSASSPDGFPPCDPDQQKRLEEAKTLLSLHRQNLAELQRRIAGYPQDKAPHFLTAQVEETTTRLDQLQQRLEMP